MQYNKLGKAGIRVSELSVGSWITFAKQLNLSEVRECMHIAAEQGVNFFDTAESYAHGEAEILLGQAAKEFRREDLVIGTKLFWGGNGPNDTGLSRKHILEGTKNSLKRLNLDYLDLLFCHRPDPDTPLEETILAMDYLVRNGLVLYWGTSCWDVALLKRTFALATELGCIPPSMEQTKYNLFNREPIEKEYLPLYQEYGLGITTWSPLESGILSGKYQDGIPPESRLAKQSWLIPSNFHTLVEKTKRLAKIADDLDCTLAQLAIAWCLKNPHVNTVITGASSKEQLLENLEALEIKEKLTADILIMINKLLK